MARLSDLTRFLERLEAIKVESKSTNSTYYKFSGCVIRVSDHFPQKQDLRTNYLTIVPTLTGEFGICIKSKIYTLQYDKLKEVITAFVAFSEVLIDMDLNRFSKCQLKVLSN